ncbi:LacI family DNA-binding transcriptional regulator [uncultured Draconibacterium sp.]|uniref:LacI family DNA-binding transcriptional regulator n=1 Tax=uncultured Draconibacterium sp. TaxID=1573823 RepID=UPI0029C76F03|nr:LacI family DNA-binding transcriptional regulator [uncultured Draconibacterium sp.]
MSNEKRTSIKDLAASLGVSTALVSFVLNGKAKQHRISEEMAQRVIKKAKEMNYSPNLVAKNLRGGKSQLIGVLVTDISNPFYSTISRIIEDRANELNYTVLFSSSDENLESTKRLIRVLLNKGVEGLIVVPCDGSKEVIKELCGDKMPLVLVDRHFPDVKVGYSVLNNFKATELITRHLIENGYKRISVITYETKMSHIQERVRGYEETMRNAGLADYINVNRIDLSNPRSEMHETLKRLLKAKTDAVVCLTNMLSINGIYCLKEMKVRIPEDIAFVGFNRSDVFNLLENPITYIKQPHEKIAVEAVNILVDKMNNDNTSGKGFIAEPELVIQSSTPKKNVLSRLD